MERQYVYHGWVKPKILADFKGINPETLKKMIPKLEASRKNYYTKIMPGGRHFHYERFDQWQEKYVHIKA